jgi:hypothetical protein
LLTLITKQQLLLLQLVTIKMSSRQLTYNNYSHNSDDISDDEGVDDIQPMELATPLALTAAAKKKKCMTWLAIYTTTITNDVVKHHMTFLETPNNYKDDILIKLLIFHQPFAAPWGALRDAWENIVSLCRNEVVGGEPVYEGNLNVKTVRGRFKKYIELIERYINDLPFKFGCDDIVETNEFMALESLYKKYVANIQLAEDNHNDTAAHQVAERIVR